MFNLDPAGLNLGTNYNVSVSSGSVMPTSAPYGPLTTFDLNNGSAGDGDVMVTITDEDDPNCTIIAMISDPGTCSDACEVTDGGLDDINCNDNGTAPDADDFITFTLNPMGVNTSTTYTVSVNVGSINPASGNYGSTTMFSLDPGSAGGGDVTVTITDDDDPNCDLDVLVTDPGPCSESCNLTNGNLGNVNCNDNSTPSQTSDDFIQFTLNPEGFNLGATYSVSVSAGTINPPSAAYGAPVSFNLNQGSAGGGDVTVTITDENDPSCTVQVVVNDPGTCSALCNLTDQGLTGVSCNDNSTPADPSDDFISFSLNPTGMNLGASYSVSVDIGMVNPASGNYGGAVSFNMNPGSAGGGNVMVTITDANDPSCILSFVLTDPGSCSNACSLTDAGLANVVCNSNGTSDTSDDYISFALNPVGNGLSAGYSVMVSVGSIDPDTAAYGGATSFSLNPGSAGAGDVTVTITDLADPSCMISVVVTDPGTCSAMCNLTGTGLGNVTCNDNATTEPSDDFISFTLDPAGSLLGTDYMVSVNTGSVNPTTAAYGISTMFSLNGGSAGGGDVIVTITDGADMACSISATITDPGACSETPCEVAACDISTDSETMICVDEGGAPDSVIVICHPGTVGMSSAWLVTDSAGLIQSIVPFSDTAVFTFEGQGSGICLVRLLAWDGTITGLMVGEDVDTLSGCFDISNAITITKLTGTECESATYNPEINALITLYPVPVSGILEIEARDVTIHRIEIFDLLGRGIIHLDQTDPVRIDLGGLDSGLYYVMIHTDRGWGLQRIIVGK
jgi:hypothetical protein